MPEAQGDAKERQQEDKAQELEPTTSHSPLHHSPCRGQWNKAISVRTVSHHPSFLASRTSGYQ